MRDRSFDFLQPWEPKWAWNELTRASFKSRLRQQEADINSGRGVHWFLTEKSNPGTILGGISLTNIRRGIAQMGTLGYWIGEPVAGKGMMAEAVNGVCFCAFNDLDLHRIEAATVLDNERSQRLLIRCGFEKEGIARDYLQINGAWRDHILFARLKAD